MCAGGVLSHAISEPTDTLREAAAAAAFLADRQLASHRAAVLRSLGWQDADRDADPRHAAEWQLLQLAIHESPVKPSSVAWSVGQVKSSPCTSGARWRVPRAQSESMSVLLVILHVIN